MPSITDGARAALAEIVDDIRSGTVYPEGLTLACYATLHDHVDANMYAADLWEEIDEPEAMHAYVNAVQDRVDDFLHRHPITVPMACVVCDRAAVGPEAGHAQGHAGWMPVCSDACTSEFYAQGGGIA